MRKKEILFLSLVLIFVMITPIFANGKNETGAKKKVIAGVVFQEDQFMKTLSAGYQAAAKERGYEIQLGNTTNDSSKENDFINTYAAQGIAGVVISPMNTQVSPAILGDGHDAGLEIAITNADIDSFPFAVAAYSADNFSFCHQTGEAAIKYLKANYKSDYKFKVGIVQFKTLVPEQSINRVNGFFAALDEAGINYEIVADQDAWLQDMAVAKCGDMLAAHPEIDFIFAANDGGTVGSVMAVENAGLGGHTVVFGTDASEQIVGLLQDKKNILQCVTGQDAYQIGYSATMALINRLEGKTFEGEGKSNIIPGIPLVRGDEDAIAAFLKNMEAQM